MLQPRFSACAVDIFFICACVKPIFEVLRMRATLIALGTDFSDVLPTEPSIFCGRICGAGVGGGDSYPDDGVQLRHGHLLGPVDRRGDLLLVLQNDTKDSFVY